MDVVAFARRKDVCLGVVLDEPPPERAPASLVLLAEDGRRFPLPPAGVLARVTVDAAGEGDEQALAALAALRKSLPAPTPWPDVHAATPQGQARTLDELLPGGEPRAVLALALTVPDMRPWFERRGPRVVAAPAERVERDLVRLETERRVRDENRAFLAWWPERPGPPPEAAAGAVAEVRRFALAGDREETSRGKALAAKAGLPEPDRILEALVDCGALPADVNPAPHRAGLADPFPADVWAQAKALAVRPVASAGRTDFRDVYTVAVDSPETTEVDDALSVRRVDGGLEVAVHICDVAELIVPGSPVDRAAMLRATSMYLPEVSVPMLPEPLVARLSLEEGVDRETLTGVFDLASDGELRGVRFERSVCRVDRRLSYEEALDPVALAVDRELGQDLLDLGSALQRRRIEGGAVALDLPSLTVSARDGLPSTGIDEKDQPARLLVAECMVLFNCAGAAALRDAGLPALFRSQEPPRGPFPDRQDPLFAVRSRRLMSPARVSSAPARHHGLGADAYAQTTSPIRRYGDLVNQWQLAATLAASSDPVAPVPVGQLDALVPHLAERERSVRRAAGQRVTYWIARMLEARVDSPEGRILEGVLSKKPRRGLGSVWVPELLRELPLRAPEQWTAPEEGTRARWRLSRILPLRGRIELAPEESS